MSNHLKVELRKLKRSLAGRYGFDLTRFCAGCWTRLGRIVKRGHCCQICKKRVCKSCRHFINDRSWICVLCYKKKYCQADFWHDDANLQRFKGSQGKSGTYLLRLTDWSSRGVLDSIATNDTSRRIHSFPDESFFGNIHSETAKNSRLLKSNSEIYPSSNERTFSDQKLTSQLSWTWNQKWRLATERAPQQKSVLQYTSATLKQKRREIRKLSLMTRNYGTSKKDEQNNSKTRQSQIGRQMEPLINMNGNHRKNEYCIGKIDCSKFLPEAAFVGRNDFPTRLSVRGIRAFGCRQKSYRRRKKPPIHDLVCKSVSLPSEMQNEGCPDYDFWHAGFVQSRVERLEADLASAWEDRFCLWDCDLEVQSLCSLELGRTWPRDGDDYRIAYLSSCDTSMESSLEYIDDCISNFGTLDIRGGNKGDLRKAVDYDMNTLDVKLNKKNVLTEDEEWDLSISSGENKLFSSSDEDGSFEFIRINENNTEFKEPFVITNGSVENNGSIGSLQAEDVFRKENVIHSTMPVSFRDGLNIRRERLINSNTVDGDKSQEAIDDSNGIKGTFTTDSMKLLLDKQLKYGIKGLDYWQFKILNEIKGRSSLAENANLNIFHIRNRPESTDPNGQTAICSLIPRNKFKNVEVSNSFQDKVKDLFDYEPLTTPFSQIYAISYGKNQSKPSLDDAAKCTDSQNRIPEANTTGKNNKFLQLVDASPEYTSCNVTEDVDRYKSVALCDASTDSHSNSDIFLGVTENPIKKFEKSNRMFCMSRHKLGGAGSFFKEEDMHELVAKSNFVSRILEINKIDLNNLSEHEANRIPLVGSSLKFLPVSSKTINPHDHFLDKKMFSVMNLNKNMRSRSVHFPRKETAALNFSKDVRFRCPHLLKNSLYSRKKIFNKKWDYSLNFKNVVRKKYKQKFHSSFFYRITNRSKMSLKSQITRNFTRIVQPKLKTVKTNLHLVVKGHAPHLRKRNSGPASKTEVVNWMADAKEIGFASARHRNVTSRTSRAAFAEHFFSFQSQFARECSRARLKSGSLPCLITVPAVQRVVERESRCSVNQWAVCSTITDGVFPQKSDGNPIHFYVARIADCCSIILDYSEIDRLDCNHVDYSKVLECLFPANVFLISAASDSTNPRCNGTSDCSKFSRIMATTNDDQRLFGKVVRTQGKNISKLMRLFDSSDRSVDSSQANFNPLSKSGKVNGLSKSQCSMQNQEGKECSNLTSETHVQESSRTEKTLQNGTEITSSIELSNLSFAHANGNSPHSPEKTMESEKTSEIPFCRKAKNSGLWDNVDIGTNNNGLWATSQQCLDLDQSATSTSELNDLIAVSKAEFSKKTEPLPSDKSNLENYFTSFEIYNKSSHVNGLTELNQNEPSNLNSSFNCDTSELNFDEECMLSDTSSEEDLRCHPALTNTNYLPAYALHTIIEESCEESDKESNNASPTKHGSKLERYFSWDMINETEANRRREKADDDSTIYSDSLSESSGSIVPEIKEIDPSQLASSRLEKYFTSGLVDEQNYFYPEDAEFLDDGPVSDFEDDSSPQKISRSALLSSLETRPMKTNNEVKDSSKKESVVDATDLPNGCKTPPPEFREIDVTIVAKSDKIACDKILEISEEVTPSEPNQSLNNVDNSSDEKLLTEEPDVLLLTEIEAATLEINPQQCEISSVEVKISENVDMLNDSTHESQKPVVNKDQLAVDIQEIIKKLLSYFTDTNTESFQKNIETDYISAWQILETEIEKLLQSLSNRNESSCNSSTIDSNNSDYGSDTIESLDCMTDEDDSIDAKGKTSKCPLVDILSSTYKMRTESDLSSFNISEETLNIWKRLIQSLQKDNSVLSQNACDPKSEARLYIRDQIITLMHTVTATENMHETIKPVDFIDNSQNKILCLTEDLNCSNEINEAININVNSLNALTDEVLGAEAIVFKFEALDNEMKTIHSETMSVETSEPDVDLNIVDSPDFICEAVNDSEIIFKSADFPSPKLNKSQPKKENELKFSIVNIELEEIHMPITEIKPSVTINEDTETRSVPSELVSPKDEPKSSPEKTIPLPFVISETPKSDKSKRDTGYYSYKSSDDSLLNLSGPSDYDVPNFKSLKRSIKKFPLSSTLSKSTANILQSSFSSDANFSTLPAKPKKTKNSAMAASSPKFSSLFSPSAVLKRFTGGSKSNETQTPESSIPPKYLKKYARSASVDDESLFGAISMPQLNNLKPGDSYSALGLYSEKDSTLDDEVESKRYFSGSQSVLSLGAHSASMSSVYSATGYHYGYVTVSGDVLFGLNYNQKSQVMEVFVKQCRNLAASDLRSNKSHPYVKVYLLPDKTRSGKRKTKVKKNTLNPVFNELLRFPVLKNDLESRTMWLSVWNSDVFGRNDFLGEISLPLGYRLLDSPTLRWYPLQERTESLTSPLKYKGELFIALKYVPRDLSLEPRFRPAPVISLRGALHILIKEAKNITFNRSGGTVDAFCKSYLLPDKSKSSKQKTPTVRRSGHPKWYYTIIYEDLSIDEIRERSLELTVWDSKITGNEFIGGVRFNIGSGLYHGVSVDWMDARRDESNLWQSMMENPNMWVDGCLPLRPTMHFQHSS